MITASKMNIQELIKSAKTLVDDSRKAMAKQWIQDLQNGSTT